MKGVIEVIDGGIGNSIQDLGRFGCRHMGIAVSGALDAPLARCANALVGNSREAAAIEIRGQGPTLAVRRGRVRLALAGEVSAVVHRADGRSENVPPWRSVSLDAEESLEVGYLPGGVAYLSISGGVMSPPQLGSRSTYPRAMLGGIGGRMLSTGQRLPCGAFERREAREYRAAPWRADSGPLRVILGPQEEHFSPESLAEWLASEYAATQEMDRMGIRLAGPLLVHRRPQDADIVSDGVTPGAIQVPGNGRPIVLLADCQTVGGYPKVATVIGADLPRLAQLRPGDRLRFAAVDAAEARRALIERERRWAGWAYRLRFAVPDTEEREIGPMWPLDIC